MKLRAIIIVALLTFVSASFAAATTQNTEAQIQKLEQQVQSLQKQIKTSRVSDQKKLEKQVEHLQKELNKIKTLSAAKDMRPQGLMAMAKRYFPNAPFVFATPSLTGSPRFDASDLITNWPSINEDLMILKNRQIMENLLKIHDLPLPNRPVIDLSGYLEGEALVNNNYDGSTKGDINLSGVELDILANVDEFASAFAAMVYDNASPMQGYRTSNSNIYLDRGFLTLGDLNSLPVYFTIGQFFVPFGHYDSYMISDSFLKTMARAKQRTALLGFSKDGFYASTYLFAGDSFIDNNKTINNFGFSLGHKYESKNFQTNVGAGFINNIADSEGIQETNAPMGFQGFSYDSIGTTGAKYENLQHQVSAIDFYGNVYLYGHFNILGEFVTTLRSFSPTDLSFNGKGASLSALNTEAAYTFKIFNRPATFAVGYEQTWQALGINLPQYGLITEASISIWRDTVEKIEYRHDINYNSSDTSSGGGMTMFLPNPMGPHNYRNVVTLHMDFYF